MSKKASLGLIESKDALDLEALRDLYVNLTGKEPTPEELAEARAKLEKVKAEDATGLGYGPPNRPRTTARDHFRRKQYRRALRCARVRRPPEMASSPSGMGDRKIVFG
jgi:hypothetical protein